MRDVKSKRLLGGPAFETADRLHSAATICYGGCACATAKAGWVRRNFPRYPYWSSAGVPDRWVNSPRLSKSAPDHESHRRGASCGRAWCAGERQKMGGGCASKLQQRERRFCRRGAGAGWNRWRTQSRHFRERAAATGRTYGPPPAGHSESLEIFARES